MTNVHRMQRNPQISRGFQIHIRHKSHKPNNSRKQQNPTPERLKSARNQHWTHDTSNLAECAQSHNVKACNPMRNKKLSFLHNNSFHHYNHSFALVIGYYYWLVSIPTQSAFFSALRSKHTFLPISIYNHYNI